jgi:hypothetical protein
MDAKLGRRVAPVTLCIVAAAVAAVAQAAPPDDACALLAPAQVSAAAGVAFGPGVYVTPTFKTTCTWNATGDVKQQDAKIITLMLEGADAFQAGKQKVQSKMLPGSSASGIGDDAYFVGMGNLASLFVRKGNVAFKVSVYGQIPVEKMQAMENALAQQVVAKLGSS